MEIVRRISTEYDYLADREYLVFHLDESQMSVTANDLACNVRCGLWRELPSGAS